MQSACLYDGNILLTLFFQKIGRPIRQLLQSTGATLLLFKEIDHITFLVHWPWLHNFNSFCRWVIVELPALRTYVQCPICLGIVVLLFCSDILLVGCDSCNHYSAFMLFVKVYTLKFQRRKENRIEVIVNVVRMQMDKVKVPVMWWFFLNGACYVVMVDCYCLVSYRLIVAVLNEYVLKVFC